MNKYSNTETFKKLSKAIDNMIITTSDYDIILNILSNYDSRLFVKILEEVSNGHMVWQDFSTVFSLDQTKFEEILETQEDLFRQVSYINSINKVLADENKMNLNKLIANYSKNNILTAEKENQLLTLLSKETDSPLENLYKDRIINKMLSETDANDGETVDKMLLSFHDYLVPVDYEFIVLTDFDRQYMLENGLSEEEMKKIKSLAAFASNYYE